MITKTLLTLTAVVSLTIAAQAGLQNSNITLAQNHDWWIEGNTPVALNADAARELYCVIESLQKVRINIKDGEDWHDILIAAFKEDHGEDWVNRNFYVTKGKSFIYFPSNEEKIPDFDSEPLEITNSMSPFHVANNSTIYFTSDYFIIGRSGPLR
jgi:hypothetical protein